MTLLYSEPIFLEHDTGEHPERADRLRPTMARLRDGELGRGCTRPELVPCARQRLVRVHARHYIDHLWGLAKSGGGALDADTVVGPVSYDVALLAAGSAVDAVERVVRGEDRTALCLVRPPGHHARAGRGMGFCLFNNVAVAARTAVAELGLQWVLVVDFDIHHGNGTQETFWEDGAVGFVSVHRWPFYPGTGAADETGSGAGLGATLNLPLAPGTRAAVYRETFIGGLERMAERLRPELVLVSAGFDAHAADPIGDLELETADFTAMTRAIVDVAGVFAGGRVVSVLEGGYHPEALADCVEGHLGVLAGEAGEDAPGLPVIGSSMGSLYTGHPWRAAAYSAGRLVSLPLVVRGIMGAECHFGSGDYTECLARDTELKTMAAVAGGIYVLLTVLETIQAHRSADENANAIIRFAPVVAPGPDGAATYGLGAVGEF